MCDQEKNSKEKEEEVTQYAEQNQVDKMVLMTIGACNGIDIERLEKEDVNVNTLFKEIRAESEAKGREEGRATEIILFGKEVHLDEGAIIKRLQERMKISAEKAKMYYSRFSDIDV